MSTRHPGSGMQRVTISEIARNAGVSLSTVSRVLNRNVPVADDKRTAVERAIQILGYRPNLVARELASGHSHAVGVVPEGIANVFHAGMLKGVEQGLRGSGYSPPFASGEGPSEQAQVLDLLLTHRVEAIILLGGRTPDEELVRLSSRVPIVAVARTIRGLENRCLRVQNKE